MDEKLALSTQQKLQQRLSPLQVQYVHMLEMSRNEVEEAVKNEVDNNPALAVSDNPNTDEDGEVYTESAEEMQRADYKDDEDVPYYRLNVSNKSADDKTPTAIMVSESSIIDYLSEQLDDRVLTDKQLLIAKYIVGNIDDNGYLQRSVSSICDDIIFQVGEDVSEREVEDVLNVVKDLEPAGVGAKDLRECLLLQIERREGTETNLLAYKVIDKYFDEFLKKHYDKIRSALSITSERTKEVIDSIRSLNPKPGNTITGVSDDSHAQQIIPDFSVEIDGENITLTLLNNLPELQIEESFSAMYDYYNTKKAKTRTDEETSIYVKEKYETASGFIKILKQRQETLFDTMRIIVKIQREFFLTGDESKLKPMVLKDIAKIKGGDVSVISRATNNKYVMTQWGIFSLKSLFNEGLQHESGEEVSSREIQSILKSVIEKEDKRKPLSDEHLCEILRKNGYEIARRTVAKYRERLNIPVARLRKEF